ncbi:hypothetical protein Hanom_Chr17g01584491 [Helianthus anomalus]
MNRASTSSSFTIYHIIIIIKIHHQHPTAGVHNGEVNDSNLKLVGPEHHHHHRSSAATPRRHYSLAGS